jgi:hypothetical protein
MLFVQRCLRLFHQKGVLYEKLRLALKLTLFDLRQGIFDSIVARDFPKASIA